MKHTNTLFILLFISIALTFTACGGGGGGGNEESKKIIDNLGTKWYVYNDDEIMTTNNIVIGAKGDYYEGEIYVPFPSLNSNSTFNLLGNRYIKYRLEAYGGSPELHFTIDEGLVVDSYVTIINGRLMRNRWQADSHIDSPDYAYYYASFDISYRESYLSFNCVKEGAHSFNPFIGTTWEAGGGDTFYFSDDKTCLVSGVEYEYQLTMVPTEDNRATLFLIRNKNYGDSGYHWNGFQYVPVDSFSIKGKYSDFNNLLQITEEITADTFDRN